MSKLIKMFRDFSGGLAEVANDNMADQTLITAKNVIPGDGYGIARTFGTEKAYDEQVGGNYIVVKDDILLDASGDATYDNTRFAITISEGDELVITVDGNEVTDTVALNGSSKPYVEGSDGTNTVTITFDGTDVILACAELADETVSIQVEHTDYAVTDKPVTLLAELALSDGTTQILAFTESSSTKMTLFVLDEGETVWRMVMDETGTATHLIDPVLDWFVYANKFYWIDGTSYRSYDGSAIAEVTEDGSNGLFTKVQASVAVEQRGTRWFFATLDNEIIFSDIGYVNKFGATSLINVTSGYADYITALREFNDGILIFQERTVHYLTGWDLAGGTDINLRKLNVTTGTKWPKTVKTVENAVLFLGNNGIYKLSIPYYSSTIAAKNISAQRISDKLNDLTPTDAYAEIYDNVYFLALREADDTITCYRYYTNYGTFWGEYTQGEYCYAARIGGENNLFIGCDNGYILKYDEDSYHYINTETGGVAEIPIEVKTKAFDVAGLMVQDSKIKRVFVVMKQFVEESSGVTIQLKVDYKEAAYAANVDSVEDVWNAKVDEVSGDESLVWSEGNWGSSYWGWVETVTKELSLNKKAKRLQFIFRDNSIDEPLLIYGVAVLYKRKKVKGSRAGVTSSTVTYDDEE